METHSENQGEFSAETSEEAFCIRSQEDIAEVNKPSLREDRTHNKINQDEIRTDTAKRGHADDQFDDSDNESDLEDEADQITPGLRQFNDTYDVINIKHQQSLEETYDQHDGPEILLIPIKQGLLTAGPSTDGCVENERCEEFDEETKWIRGHIKRRECSQFIEDPNQEQTPKGERRCYCGYLYNEHSNEAQEGAVEEGTKWDYMKHSLPKMTNAFGEMEFIGYGGNVRKYVRVDVETKMSDMLELMMKVWGLDKPKLLISVIGGAENFNMSKRLRDTFRHGLLTTILTTGAWIVAGGTNEGVMKHVGKAVEASSIASINKNQVISIGIAPWGCVQNKEALIDETSKGLWPAKYLIGKGQSKTDSFLDPNHSHFVLVDNATQNTFAAAEIQFRENFEKEIAKNNTGTGENAVSVPSILLVLAGDLGTLENVHQAIKNNTPIVVVKSSGRAADILAYAYLNAKEGGIEATDHAGKKHKETRQYLEDSVQIKVREMIEHEFGNKETMSHLKHICDCLEKSDFISVYDIEGKGGVKGIEATILQALLKANKYQVMDQLRLALAWNRIDVAKSVILIDDHKLPTKKLDGVTFSAILLNRIDFINLFLDHGVNLKEFLTKRRLLMLYNKIPSNCLLRTMLESSKKADKNAEFSLKDVGMLIRDLLGETFHPKVLGLDYVLDKMKPTQEEDYMSCQFEQPFLELFVWSILMMYQDMAKLCWAEGKDPIATALVGNNLLKTMLRKTDDKELVKRIQAFITEWSDLATGVLSDCHSTDEDFTQALLVREQSKWGKTSCMLMAVQAENKDFISQNACQSLLNRIWNGRLVQDISRWRLLLCLICPFLICVLLDFTKPDTCAHQSTYTKGDNKNRDSNQDSHNNQDYHNNKIKIQKTRQLMATRGSELSVFDKFYYFFTAPVIIFLYNLCSYLVFLSLYTYILIFKFDRQVNLEEIILMIWVFAITTEEIRQMVMNSSTTLSKKIQSYISDTWNKVDTMTIVVFIIGIILRFMPYERTFEAARVVLALNFVTFFLRLLHIFSVHKELGPKLVMIGKMIQDLMYFLLILMVFVFSYAISSNSILYPNSPLTWNTAVQIIRKSYWNIYGELFLEEIEGEADCSYDATLWLNGTQARCPTDTGKWLVPIMMGIYMMIANVLLLNLLIAMFSNTFRKVQDNTDKHWHFQRYSLINEYYNRPVLFPPLILLAHIYLLFGFICESCCCKVMKKQREETENCFCRKFKNERELIKWENVIAHAFHRKRELEDVADLEHKVDSTHNIIEEIQQQLEVKIPPRLDSRLTHIEEIQQQLEVKISSRLDNRLTNIEEIQQQLEVKIPPRLDSRLTNIEEILQQLKVKIEPRLDRRLNIIEKQLESTQKSLEWIISTLQNNSVKENKPAEPAQEVLYRMNIRDEEI
ncbi:transient receptor potential cation channel subfamily M member-like 2 isoform X2 [Mya arenaria]|uniref:transient receptor potential cation channel subfamily M member-like 2 isoform X2 n=1 Tax=Mya arenaria TaxID=6604 RepID=UPI0022E04FE6|nr:transient receptor potential cation channel subfamily M member-like 2 isoform X2 [Mya arenaria]